MSSQLKFKNYDESPWMYDILKSIQLEDFYKSFVSKLQITEIFHFDHVSIQDLKKIGLSYPAICRLIEALKLYRENFNLPPSNAPIYNFQRHQKNSRLKILKRLIFSKDYHNDFNIKISDNKLISHENQISLLNPSDIKLYDKIGSGVSSFVYRGDWTSPKSQTLPVAVKVMKNKIYKSDYQTITLSMINEFKIMQNIRHPNLLQLFGICLKDQIMIVTELAPLGSLLRMLRAHKSISDQLYTKTVNRCFMVDSLWNICYQIVNAMKYLSEANFIHRDLAARNILVFSIKPNNYPHIKIGDFGMAHYLNEDNLEYREKKLIDENNSEDPMNNSPLPVAWSAIESLESNCFSEASDVWSWGVLAWEIWTFGSKPWPSLGLDELITKLRKGYRLSWPKLHCPRSMYQIMLSAWNLNPLARPSFNYLNDRLEHIKPFQTIARENFDEIDRLGIEKNDLVLIFDAPNKSNWWRGQNSRTGEIGSIPSNLLEIVDQKATKLFTNENRDFNKDLDELRIYYDSKELLDEIFEPKENLEDERTVLKKSKGTIEMMRKLRKINKAEKKLSFVKMPDEYKTDESIYNYASANSLDYYFISDLKNNQTNFKIGGLKDPSFPLHMPSTRFTNEERYMPSAPPLVESDTEMDFQDFGIKPSAPSNSVFNSNFDINEIYTASFVNNNDNNKQIPCIFPQKISTQSRNATTGGDAFHGLNLKNSFQSSKYNDCISRSLNDFSCNQNPFKEDGFFSTKVNTWNRLNKLEEVFIDPIDLVLEIEAINSNFRLGQINEETIKSAITKVLSSHPHSLGVFVSEPIPEDVCSMDQSVKAWRIETVTKLIKLDRLESLLILNRDECSNILVKNNWNLNESQKIILSKK